MGTLAHGARRPSGEVSRRRLRSPARGSRRIAGRHWTACLSVGFALGLGLAACAPAPVQPPPIEPPRPEAGLEVFHATAYSIEGQTAAGSQSRSGIVAADPKVLPLGSRIRVEEAGEYSGEYVVQDRGPAVRGHELDIYLPSDREAKAFGKRKVKVRVLEYGDGSRAGARNVSLPADEAMAPALR